MKGRAFLLVLVGAATAFLGLLDGVSAAKASDWYESDPMARKLSQLSPEEIEILDGSGLLHHKPIILPKSEYIVSGNDYFDWPIATKVEDTIVVLFDRRHFHGGKPKDAEPQWDENSGIRMILTSSDGGRSWSDPLDVFEQAGMWETTIFDGWGGGLGAHNGVVYLALNEGIYHSHDKGKSWALITPEPDFSNIPGKVKPAKADTSSGVNPAKETTGTFWSPSMRLTFDEAHGLTLWTTRDFKPSNRNKGEAEERNANYGKYLCAIYSRDFGKSWEFEEQAIPEGVTLSEITPLQHDGKLVFFLRNGILRSYYAQAYSGSGWFPFDFAVTNVSSMNYMDTPDVIFNPVTQRYEAAVTNRTFRNSGIPMEMQLWSISPDEWAAGSATWRFEGVLLRYSKPFGMSDGMNPVASIIDEQAGVQRIYIWGGTVQEESGIFQYSRSLDTPALSKYLKSSRPPEK